MTASSAPSEPSNDHSRGMSGWVGPGTDPLVSHLNTGALRVLESAAVFPMCLEPRVTEAFSVGSIEAGGDLDALPPGKRSLSFSTRSL